MMTYVYIAIGAIVAGYLGFLLILKLLPKRLQADRKKEHKEILTDARNLAEQQRESEKERTEEDIGLLREELEADIHERQEDLKVSEEDLKSRERSIQMEESRLAKAERDLKSHEGRVEKVRNDYEQKLEELQEFQKKLQSELEERSGADAERLKKSLEEKQVESRQIEAQKSLKFLEEELDSSSRRLAYRTMSRAMARYAPNFYWPKSTNFVELSDRNLIDQLSADGSTLLEEMKEKAGVEVDLLADNEEQTPVIKLGGGAGINREAARLALQEILPKSQSGWEKAAEAYDKHREKLEKEAVELGKKAIRELQLPGIHPEIQKLVGYLNWRTSYRQNQWYHTVEVAKLAGIIAHELKVDPDQAKRVGLLHDIGKAIDYRIEGSHAVISGDYADRFGERRVVCDTVMSHHNDLVIETPLAYVLRAADTLSGARPGARVNLEEGYQNRLSGIDQAVRSFPGVINVAIMNGAREVHVEVNHKKVHVNDLEQLSHDMARKVAEDVAFPGEIKILVSRRFEATAVA